MSSAALQESAVVQHHAPPFRAEHIGSLLRPAELLDLQARLARGEASREALAEAESRAIAEVIALQERVGLKLVTDGEIRRRSYHSYFYAQLGDIVPDAMIDTPGTGRGAQPTAIINSPVKWTHSIHADDYRLLAARSKALPKITIPGPCALHFRGGDAAVLASAYTSVDTFWSDTVQAFRQELTSLAEAGCTYVQIDETAFAKFGDPDVQATLAARGDDWSRLIDLYIEITNAVLRGLPPSMRIGMHLCRGNRGGHWHAAGSYDSVADRLFNAMNIGCYFLEYDSERSGSLTPLRLVPAGKTVILGLVSTKTSEMENKADLLRRIEEASRYVALDQLGISPQCGFASVAKGNPISPQTQEAKLRLVVDTAREVWGTA